MITTELSDEGLDMVYKRYKVLQYMNYKDEEDMEEEAQDLISEFNAGFAKTEDDHNVTTILHLRNELGMVFNKKAQRKRLNMQLEQHMAELRFMHSLNNLNLGDVYNDQDPNFPGWAPFEDVRDSELLSDVP